MTITDAQIQSLREAAKAYVDSPRLETQTRFGASIGGRWPLIGAASTILALLDERERLRQALEAIATSTMTDAIGDVWFTDDAQIARAALTKGGDA